MFQSSFELTGYITLEYLEILYIVLEFQSSFELTGYITVMAGTQQLLFDMFQSSFELTGYITDSVYEPIPTVILVSKLFRAYRLYNSSFLKVLT